MSIKKSILTIVSIIIVLSLTQIVITNTMKRCEEGTIGKINRIVIHEVDYNFTIWGASTADININPKIIIDTLKCSTYNMGINGTNIDQYAGLLYEYIENTRESKIIIIALDIFGGLEERHSFYDLHNWVHNIDNDNIYECLKGIDPKTIELARYFPLYKLTLFDKNAFPYFRRTLLNIIAKKDHNYGYGYDINSNEILKLNPDNVTIPINVKIDNRPYHKIVNALKKAKEKNIKCYIVITPCYEKGLHLLVNKKDFIKKINTLSKYDATILDYSNTFMSKNPSLFKDNTHLNPKGANVFTKVLVQDIKNSLFNEN